MKKKLLLAAAIGIISAASVYAQDKPDAAGDTAAAPVFSRFGFMDLNMYYDTRDASTFTVNYLATLTSNLTYFSFINYQQDFYPNERLDDFQSFYSEHVLYYALPKIPFDLTLQGVLSSGPKNEKLRLGVNWKAHKTPGLGDFLSKLGVEYSANFHLVQFGYDAPLDDFTWQIEHVWMIRPFARQLDNRLYISGFADQTIGGDIARGLVTETQLGVRLFRDIYAVGEYRHFSYFTGEYRNGFGLGVQYLILFN